MLTWEPDGATIDAYPSESGDNHILASAHRIAEVAKSNGLPHYQVVVISEDSNLLLKCDALGMSRPRICATARSPSTMSIRSTRAWSAAGSTRMPCRISSTAAPRASGRSPSTRSPPSEPVEYLWNMGVVLACGEHTILGRVNADTGRVEDLKYAQYWDRKRKDYKPRPILGFTPRDPQQILAMEFLLDPDVQLVVLDGPAGSGKTRMMVATGLYMLIGQPTTWRVAPTSQPLTPDYGYDHGMLLLRPEHASSQYDLGYLPGDYESKLSPWLEPFFQAVRSLSLANEHDFLDELQSTDRLTMVSTSMLRGLDIERSIVLVDELQNGDRHLAKTLMSRFCASSKVALAGCLDPVQIDNPYVDWRSNALTRIKETYKGFGPEVAQVRLVHNYRGPISTRADKL